MYENGKKPLVKGEEYLGKRAYHEDNERNERHKEFQALKGKGDCVTTTTVPTQTRPLQEQFDLIFLGLKYKFNSGFKTSLLRHLLPVITEILPSSSRLVVSFLFAALCPY